MKIELDHQELKSVLEHLERDKKRFHDKIRLVLEPAAQMAARLAGDHFSGPQVVPDEPAAQAEAEPEPEDRDTEPSTGTGA